MSEPVKEVLILLATSGLATLGFAILFYAHPRRLALAALGGLLTCGVYLLAQYLLGGEFLPNLLAALVGAGFSEICARLTRVPVPVYMVPGIIPLVPGRAMYETLFSLVSGQYAAAGASGLLTLKIALGIAGGIVAASVIGLFIRPRRNGAPSEKKRA